MLKVFVLFIIQFVFTFSVHGQKMMSDLYLFEFNLSSDSINLGQCYFINGNNVGGFNNDLSFINQDRAIFSSDKDNEFTELYQIDFSSKLMSRLTQNEKSEYNPQLRPGFLDRYTVISLEKTGFRIIRQFKMNDEVLDDEKIITTFQNVENFHWLDRDNLIVVLNNLNGESDLYIVDIKSGNEIKLIESVGSCIKSDDDKGFYFIHKLTADYWYLKYCDIITKRVSIIVQMIGEIEHFELISKDRFILGNGSQLYTFESSKNNDWVLMSDLKLYGINNIEEISIKESKLVISNSRK